MLWTVFLGSSLSFQLHLTEVTTTHISFPFLEIASQTNWIKAFPEFVLELGIQFSHFCQWQSSLYFLGHSVYIH